MTSSGALWPPRSVLFVPASRPDLAAKAHRWRPDLVAVDLEDAVAATDKDRARSRLGAAVAALAPSTPACVRVNPARSRWFDADLEAASACGAWGVMLPKYESSEDIARLREVLGSRTPIIVGIESARGVADASPLLGAGVDAAYFGAEDYIADLGGRRSRSSAESLYARSAVVLASRLAGVHPIDQAFTRLKDHDGFRSDADAGRDLGFRGKICIHPAQVALAHRAFTPSDEEAAHARRVVSAGAAGVAEVDGQMIDEVHLRMAAHVLSRYREADVSSEGTDAGEQS